MLFRLTGFMLVLLLLTGCAGRKAETVPPEPVVDVPKLNVPPDPGIYKVLTVIRRFGKKTVTHMSYSDYVKGEASAPDAAFNPDTFYDRYLLDLNEKNYWVTLTLRTAVRAKRNDSRIRKLMEHFPENAIDAILKTPAEKTFLLSDSNADGVLDFAAPEGKNSDQGLAVDIRLLRSMQRTYSWILGIIKRHYK